MYTLYTRDVSADGRSVVKGKPHLITIPKIQDYYNELWHNTASQLSEIFFAEELTARHTFVFFVYVNIIGRVSLKSKSNSVF